MAPPLHDLTQTASRLHLPAGARWGGMPAPAVPRFVPSPDDPAVGHAGATWSPPQILPDSRATRGTSARALREEAAVEGVRLSEVAGPLSFALDIAEGQPMGHAVRSTLIGMRIADSLGLPDQQRSALFYGLLLKDLGGSSSAGAVSALFGADDRLVKSAWRLTDWSNGRESARHIFTHSLPGRGAVAKAWHTLKIGLRGDDPGRALVRLRATRGAEFAGQLDLPRGAAEAIAGLDEHWDGSGRPDGLGGSGIPMLARIAGLAQTVEAFATAFDVRSAYAMAHARRGRWFDPVLVDCLDVFQMDSEFWGNLRHADVLAALHAMEPEDEIIRCDDERLDGVAGVFAQVTDAKSPFTASHSTNVAVLAARTGEAMGLDSRELRTLKRAALLHDLGKLGVSNAVVDKPTALDELEVETMRQSPRVTLEILKRVRRLRLFAATAAATNERLDGSGYHLGLSGQEIGKLARILAVADVTEACTADRPYRAGMPVGQVTGILDSLVAKQQLDGEATEALKGWFEGLPQGIMPMVAAAA